LLDGADNGQSAGSNYVNTVTIWDLAGRASKLPTRNLFDAVSRIPSVAHHSAKASDAKAVAAHPSAHPSHANFDATAVDHLLATEAVRAKRRDLRASVDALAQFIDRTSR
jgi:hypothetical protein